MASGGGDQLSLAGGSMWEGDKHRSRCGRGGLANSGLRGSGARMCVRVGVSQPKLDLGAVGLVVPEGGATFKRL